MITNYVSKAEARAVYEAALQDRALQQVTKAQVGVAVHTEMALKGLLQSRIDAERAAFQARTDKLQRTMVWSMWAAYAAAALQVAVAVSEVMGGHWIRAIAPVPVAAVAGLAGYALGIIRRRWP